MTSARVRVNVSRVNELVGNNPFEHVDSRITNQLNDAAVSLQKAQRPSDSLIMPYNYASLSRYIQT